MTTQCDNACVNLENDPHHCGTCSMQCPEPASGGVSTCKAKACGVQCISGYHQCGANPECAKDNDATHCGASCTNCPGTTNGDPACVNNACAVTCHSGYHLCGSTCASDTDATKCGSSCQNCGGTICYQGACSACAPNPTPTNCASNTPQFCNTTGQWQNVATGACPGASTCSNGSCVCNATMCPSGCVNLNTDGHNCGSCGHDCQGGMCQGGKCQPVVLASAQNHPYAVVIDASNVYWTNTGDIRTGNGSVMRVAITGTSAAVPVATAQEYPLGIAVDGMAIYWSVYSNAQGSGSSGEIRATPIGGGSVTPLASGEDFPGPVARDASLVYWANTGMNRPALRRVLKSGGAAPQDVRTGIYPGVGSLAVDANNAYATTSFFGIQRLDKIPLNGTGDIVIGNGAPGWLAIDASSVYWADGGNNAIHKASVTAVDTSTATDVAANQSAPIGVAVDPSGIYWANSGNGTIMKLAAGQSVPVTVAQGQSSPSGIALDGANIYWVNNVASGSVMKLAK